MRILAVSDIEEKGLRDLWTPERTKGVDLIISCGDLRPDYLGFLAAVTNADLFYVHGNHDGEYGSFDEAGGTCMEDRIVRFGGLRIMGLGGSMRYKPGNNLYSEREMLFRAARLSAAAACARGIDILVTHAPPRGFGDLEDLPHRGFETFNRILNLFRPALMLHGHIHPCYGRIRKERTHPAGTEIINVCGYRVIDL